MIKTISIQEYLEMDKSSKYFIFKMEGCRLCDQMVRNTEERNPDLVYVVAGKLKDEEIFMMNNVDAVPLSMTFNEAGENSFRKFGVLNEKQMQEFLV